MRRYGYRGVRFELDEPKLKKIRQAIIDIREEISEAGNMAFRLSNLLQQEKSDGLRETGSYLENGVRKDILHTVQGLYKLLKIFDTEKYKNF